MTQVLAGAVVMGFFVAGLFFLRFWRETRDRLFAMFAVAFWIMGINRFMLAIDPTASEGRTWPYLIRLLAFVIILVAIIDKNRSNGPAG